MASPWVFPWPFRQIPPPLTEIVISLETFGTGRLIETKYKTVGYWVPAKEGMEWHHLMSIQLLLEVTKKF